MVAKYQDLTVGQMEAVVNMMGGMEKLHATLRGEYTLTLIAKAVGTLLQVVGKVAVALKGKLVSSEFFTTRDGIFVVNSFQELFVGDDNSTVDSFVLSKCLLTMSACDSNIRKELPENHVFTSSEFCQVIASMITSQWDGKEGDLLSNGYANIFYVQDKNKKRVFTVLVRWNSDDREFCVRVWGLGGRGWRAGRAVFSRN